MAREQRCPDVQRLQGLIRKFQGDEIAIIYPGKGDALAPDEQEETVEALTWLKDFLLSRRNYQRKQQVKRKVMQKILNEHDLAGVLDETIRAQYGEDLERFDDNVEDED